jgi:hypothetical protein
MRGAISGIASGKVSPGYRFAHPGYLPRPLIWCWRVAVQSAFLLLQISNEFFDAADRFGIEGLGRELAIARDFLFYLIALAAHGSPLCGPLAVNSAVD